VGAVEGEAVVSNGMVDGILIGMEDGTVESSKDGA